ncbi:MAG: heavy metal-binding domain-containing protein [Ferruginibacter sp.]
MKTISIFASLLFSIFALNTYAQKATSQTKETIKVWGNCGMCKSTIEKAAKKGGAAAADWDKETKALTVSYATDKTSSQLIQQAIAKAGYDTQDLTGDDKAYSKLPGCCHYDRKEVAASAAYSCPMHPDVTSNEAGKCSKCGMSLTASKKETMKMQQMYKCPMHADITSDKEGTCSKCGMALQTVKQ